MQALRTCLLVLCCVGAAAQTAMSEDAAQRERIASERAAVQSRYDDAMRACAAEFAVTACVNRAKAERRAAIDVLNQEQATLDASVRKARAAERNQRIEEKQRTAAARAPASAPSERARAPRQPAAPASTASRSARPPTGDARASEAAEAAAERRADAERRRLKAEAHAEEVHRRNAERASKKPPAAPLPPASAAIR